MPIMVMPVSRTEQPSNSLATAVLRKDRVLRYGQPLMQLLFGPNYCRRSAHQT